MYTLLFNRLGNNVLRNFVTNNSYDNCSLKTEQRLTTREAHDISHHKRVYFHYIKYWFAQKMSLIEQNEVLFVKNHLFSLLASSSAEPVAS